MSGLLVSVRNLSESEIVFGFLGDYVRQSSANPNVRLPIDVLDIKEPSAGSLGSPSSKEVLKIARRVCGKALHDLKLSVALGEICDGDFEYWFSKIQPEEKDLLGRVGFWKVGLSQINHSENTQTSDWLQKWKILTETIPAGSVAVPVIYLDHVNCNSHKPMALLKLIVELNVDVVLFDTFDKSHGNLLNHIDCRGLGELTTLATEYGIRTALAGSIGISEIPKLLAVQPEWLGVRGAICAKERIGTIDLNSLASFVGSFSKLIEARS